MGDGAIDDAIPMYDRGPMYAMGRGYVDVGEGEGDESDEGGHFCVGRMRISRDGSWTMVGQANQGRRNSPHGQGSGFGRNASHPQSKASRRRNRKKNRGATTNAPNYDRSQAAKKHEKSSEENSSVNESFQESDNDISDEMVEDYMRNCRDSDHDVADDNDVAALSARFLVTSPDEQCPIDGGVLIHDDNEGEDWDGSSVDEDDSEDEDDSGSNGSGSDSSGYSYGDLAAAGEDVDDESADSDEVVGSDEDEDGKGCGCKNGAEAPGQGGDQRGGGKKKKKKKKRLEASFTRLRFGPDGDEVVDDDGDDGSGSEDGHVLAMGRQMLADNLDLDAFLGYRKPSRKSRRHSEPIPGRTFGAPMGMTPEYVQRRRQGSPGGGASSLQGSPAYPVCAKGPAKRPKNLRPGEKKQLKQEAMEAKRAQRMSSRGFDLDAVNKSLRRFVASQEDMWGGQAPRGKPEMAQVTRVARLYRLQVSLQGGGKKRILIVRRTRGTCMPEGEMAASLAKELELARGQLPRHAQLASAHKPKGQRWGGGDGAPGGTEHGSASKKQKKGHAQDKGGKRHHGKGGAGGSNHATPAQGRPTPRLRYASQPLAFVSNGVYDPNKDDEMLWRLHHKASAAQPSSTGVETQGHADAGSSNGDDAVVSVGLGAGGLVATVTAVDSTVVAAAANGPPHRHHPHHHRGMSDAGGGSSRRAEPVVAGGGFGEFEQHTLGFGSRMLAKMGFKGCGSGLGKNQHGRSDPIGVIMRPKSLGLGADG